MKDLYPSTSKFARRGVGNFCGRAAPCEPTDALPGTVEKLAVLELRARLGQELFHPLDVVVGGNGHAVPWTVPMVRWWRRGSKEEIEATDLGSDYTP